MESNKLDSLLGLCVSKAREGEEWTGIAERNGSRGQRCGEGVACGERRRSSEYRTLLLYKAVVVGLNLKAVKYERELSSTNS